jgi:hypothetical protein
VPISLINEEGHQPKFKPVPFLSIFFGGLFEWMRIKKMEFIGMKVKYKSTVNSLKEEKNEHPCSPMQKVGIEPGWVWL